MTARERLAFLRSRGMPPVDPWSTQADAAGAPDQAPDGLHGSEAGSGGSGWSGAPYFDASSAVGEQPECWICRDSFSTEPLVQPCQCRGSMAGVHASCVEAWVQFHRQEAGHEAPRCPVCRTRYGGRVHRPGAKVFARQVACGFSRQLILSTGEAMRFLLLGTVLMHYSGSRRKGGFFRSVPAADAGSPEEEEDSGESASNSSWGALEDAVRLSARALATMLLAAFLLHKMAVLTSSLPLNRDPPRGRFGRRFYTTDLWCIARHVAELLAAVVLLGMRTACGELPFANLAPVIGLAAIPLLYLLLWYPVSACVKEAAALLFFLCCAPLWALLEVWALVQRHRRRLLNPLDGPLHMAIALVAVVMCLLSPTRRSTLVLFAGHSSLLLAILLGRALLRFRRLPWRPGHAWWCSLLTALVATSLAWDCRWFTLLLLLAALRALQRAATRPRPQSLFKGPLWWCTLLVAAEAASLALRGDGSEVAPTVLLPEQRKPPVQLAAGSWLALLAAVAVVVNWGRCAREYHTWQRRHATFVLCADGTTAAAAAAGPVDAPAQIVLGAGIRAPRGDAWPIDEWEDVEEDDLADRV